MSFRISDTEPLYYGESEYYRYSSLKGYEDDPGIYPSTTNFTKTYKSDLKYQQCWVKYTWDKILGR